MIAAHDWRKQYAWCSVDSKLEYDHIAKSEETLGECVYLLYLARLVTFLCFLLVCSIQTQCGSSIQRRLRRAGGKSSHNEPRPQRRVRWPHDSVVLSCRKTCTPHPVNILETALKLVLLVYDKKCSYCPR